MNTGTVESSRYASYADAYFSDLMADSSFWPVKVRDIAEPLSDCWAEDEPDDRGQRAMADAALYDLCLSTATTGGQHETFLQRDVRKSLTCGNDAPKSCRGTCFGDSRNAFCCLRHCPGASRTARIGSLGCCLVISLPLRLQIVVPQCTSRRSGPLSAARGMSLESRSASRPRHRRRRRR